MIDLEKLITSAAEIWSVDHDDIVGAATSSRVVSARAACIACLRRHTDYTYQEIGDLFGGRSGQAAYLLNLTLDNRMLDPVFKARMNDLCTRNGFPIVVKKVKR